MDQFRNSNGSYNGIKALAAWSGLSETEVAWTAGRIQALMKAGKSAAEAKAMVKEESKLRPWEDQHDGGVDSVHGSKAE